MARLMPLGCWPRREQTKHTNGVDCYRALISTDEIGISDVYFLALDSGNMFAIVLIASVDSARADTANVDFRLSEVIMTASSVASGRVCRSANLHCAAAILKVPCLLSMTAIMISMSTSISLAQTGNLVTAPVDGGVRVVLQGQRAAWALPRNSAGAVPADTRLEHLTLGSQAVATAAESLRAVLATTAGSSVAKLSSLPESDSGGPEVRPLRSRHRRRLRVASRRRAACGYRLQQSRDDRFQR